MQSLKQKQSQLTKVCSSSTTSTILRSAETEPNGDVDGEVEYKFINAIGANGDDDNSYHMLVVGGRPPD